MTFLFLLTHHFICCYIFCRVGMHMEAMVSSISRKSTLKKGVLPSWIWPFVIIRELFVKKQNFLLSWQCRNIKDLNNQDSRKNSGLIHHSWTQSSLLTWQHMCFLYHTSTILCTPKMYKVMYNLSRKWF